MADEHHHQTTVSIKEISFTGEYAKYQMSFKVSRAEGVNERTKERKGEQTKERHE